MSLIAKMNGSIAAALLLASACPAATIGYRIEGAIPEQYLGTDVFAHFQLYGEAGDAIEDTALIKNFQSDGVHYNFDPSVGTVSGVFPGDVVLYDNDGTGNYSVYNQRVKLGTTISFDVFLSGPQWEGTTPVATLLNFAFLMDRNTSSGYEVVLPDSYNMGSVEVFRDPTFDSGNLNYDANSAFTVTAIPEPGAFALLGLLGVGLRRRRR